MKNIAYILCFTTCMSMEQKTPWLNQKQIKDIVGAGYVQKVSLSDDSYNRRLLGRPNKDKQDKFFPQDLKQEMGLESEQKLPICIMKGIPTETKQISEYKLGVYPFDKKVSINEELTQYPIIQSTWMNNITLKKIAQSLTKEQILNLSPIRDLYENDHGPILDALQDLEKGWKNNDLANGVYIFSIDEAGDMRMFPAGNILNSKAAILKINASLVLNQALFGYLLESQAINQGIHDNPMFYPPRHSSLLGGGNTLCAGEIEISSNKIMTILNDSGHYMPSAANIFYGFFPLYKKYPQFFKYTNVTYRTANNPLEQNTLDLLEFLEKKPWIEETKFLFNNVIEYIKSHSGIYKEYFEKSNNYRMDLNKIVDWYAKMRRMRHEKKPFIKKYRGRIQSISSQVKNNKIFWTKDAKTWAEKNVEINDPFHPKNEKLYKEWFQKLHKKDQKHYRFNRSGLFCDVRPVMNNLFRSLGYEKEITNENVINIEDTEKLFKSLLEIMQYKEEYEKEWRALMDFRKSDFLQELNKKLFEKLYIEVMSREGIIWEE